MSNSSASLLQAIHHIAIIALDYQRSKHFYHVILGLPIIQEVYRASRDSYKLDLRINDGSQIELFSFPVAPPRPSAPEACGLRHLAFRVANIEQMIARLQEHGVICEDIRVDEYSNKRFTFFPDPDGLPLELYEI